MAAIININEEKTKIFHNLAQKTGFSQAKYLRMPVGFFSPFFIVCHFISFIFINNISTFVKVARLDFLGSLLPHFERLLRPRVKKRAEKG